MLVRAALVAVLFSSLAASTPPASAQSVQTLTLEVVAPTHEIQPESESAIVTVTATLSCDVVLASAPPGGTVLILSFTAGEGDVLINGPTTLLVPSDACVEGLGEAAVSQDYDVSVTREALARVEVTVDVHARVESSSPGGIADADAKFTVTAAPYLLIQPMVPKKLQICSCDTLAYDIELTNHGNARTTNSFSVVSQPGGDWKADLPADLVLEPGETGAALIVLHLAGGNSQGAFTFAISTSTVSEPVVHGEPVTLNLLARHRPPLGIPGPSAPLVMLGLAGLALALRQRDD